MDREEIFDLLQYDKCCALIEASKVRRWHSKPSIPNQQTGDHSFSMLLILVAIHPNPSSNLMQAVIRHDLSERIGADFPHDMKKRFPILKEIDEQMQEEFDTMFELPTLNLSQEDKIWLSLLDQLEPCIFIEYNISEPTEESIDVYENCMNLVFESMQKLQDFGYFRKTNSTVN